MLVKVRLKTKTEYKTRDIYSDVLFFISKKRTCCNLTVNLSFCNTPFFSMDQYYFTKDSPQAVSAIELCPIFHFVSFTYLFILARYLS